MLLGEQVYGKSKRENCQRHDYGDMNERIV